MMTILVQLIIAFSVSLFNDSKSIYEFTETVTLQPQLYVSIRAISDTPKEKAFQILENKCNVCHSKRNRQRVFTEDNMNPWADDVYKQVFIKKRMPKGKKIKLTSQEYQDLLTWVSATQNK
ncbi:hypothetical protein ACWGOQ_0019645 [Aquimarina sp. M1]